MLTLVRCEVNSVVGCAIQHIALVQGAFSLVLLTRENISLALVQYYSLVLHGNKIDAIANQMVHAL